jgi:hypothetical protein
MLESKRSAMWCGKDGARCTKDGKRRRTLRNA